MKTNEYKKGLILIGFLISGVLFPINSLKAQVVMDLVCGMNVNTAESFDYKYNGKIYYFDSYACKESFKNNPTNFLEKTCVPNDNIIDLVCGKKVKIEESYDFKYAKRVHHFHSYECREAFKMNPEKFMKNICVPKDSIK